MSADLRALLLASIDADLAMLDAGTAWDRATHSSWERDLRAIRDEIEQHQVRITRAVSPVGTSWYVAACAACLSKENPCQTLHRFAKTRGISV